MKMPERVDASAFAEAMSGAVGEARTETRGRKKKAQASEDVRAMDLVVQKQHEQELSIAEVDKMFLEENETYNFHICMTRARDALNKIGDGMLEAGAQLLLLKAHMVRHGEFLDAVEALGLEARAAQLMMLAAKKFSNTKTFSHLSSSKIYALSVLADESIKTLDDGGTLEGVGTLDDVERMTVRELRSALRAEKKKRKEEREAQEAAISQKEQKLNELEAELRYREPPTKEQLAQAALDDMKKDLFKQIGVASFELERLEDLIEKAQKVEGVTVGQLDDWLVFEEPKNFLASIFELSDELKDMTENIRPARAKSIAQEAE